MPLMRIGNVQVNLEAKGIDLSTDEGHNALINLVLEIVPNAQSFGYIPEEDILQIYEPYIPPARVSEFGEVQSIDYSMG